MTRSAAGSALALALLTGMAQTAGATPMAGFAAASGQPSAASAPAGAPSITRVEYYCSPGFEPSYGGTCVAVPARAEIELFIDQPIYGEVVTRRVVHRRHRHGLRARF